MNYNNYNNENGVRPYWWIIRQSKQKLKSEYHPSKEHTTFPIKDKQRELCYMTDFEKVTDFKNMYNAYRKSLRGKGFKVSSAKFSIMALEGINMLIEQLNNKIYRVSDYNEFKVYEPKERIIKTTSFKDKVIQHSLCDNVLLPKMQEIFKFCGSIFPNTRF